MKLGRNVLLVVVGAPLATVLINLAVFSWMSVRVLHLHETAASASSAALCGEAVLRDSPKDRQTPPALSGSLRVGEKALAKASPSSSSSSSRRMAGGSVSQRAQDDYRFLAQKKEILARYGKQEISPLTNIVSKGTCGHRPISATHGNESTVEYIACCGLGHRMARTSSAARVAAALRTNFYVHWGCCEELDLATYLFGPEPFVLHDKEAEDSSVAQANPSKDDPSDVFHIQFRNEVVGMTNRIQMTKAERCPCTDGKLESDYSLFTQMMQRYKNRNAVDDFVQKHFEGRTVVGIHVRAGNGETGDFLNKGRSIDNKEAFVASMVGNITLLTKDVKEPPAVFIATDTPSYVTAFREALKVHNIELLDLPQSRPKEGEGVLFGEQAARKDHEKEKCLAGWDAVLQDMMLLSHADMLIIPKTSSFTQTMPLSLILGRPVKKVEAPFCEFKNYVGLSCYTSLQDWCCNGSIGGQVFRDVNPEWRHLYL